ncbi:MAG: chromosome segregation protein SMC [bacterium]|nr:chromosome segregation protein SMC [bacterium]
MYLKRLDIYGFKTFAAKTEVEFTPGFMGVVGPNGSGKSNLTDAIRYCLGEQSAKVLRASRQDELIFAGTPQRHSAPFCSVTATFDNSDGAFPLDFAEVAITRKTTRDGDSQYYINKTSCRQRDIHELLMGSGIGPGSFSVLGNKEINNVLSSDPRERRLMLEETAGTNRYRFRKKEALRKLEQTKQNLTRLNDIMVEVDRSVEESEKALARYRKYKEAQDELKGLELKLAWAQHSELTGQLENCSRETAEAQLLSQNADTRENELGASLAQLEMQQQENIAQMQSLQKALTGQAADLAACKASFDGLFEQDRQLEISARAASQRLESAGRRMQERQNAYLSVQNGLPELERELQNSKDRLQECRRLLENCPSASAAELAAARSHIAKLEGKLRQLETQKAGQQARAEQDERRLSAIKEEIARIAGELPEIADKSAALSEAQALIAETAERQQQLNAEKERLKSEIAQNRQKSEQAEQLRLQYHRKVQEYEGSVNQRFGMPEAQRTVLGWRDAGVVGAVAELIKVRPGMETALEAALGGRMFDIITEDRQAASRLIDRLKRERLGRVTFWPLDLVQKDTRRQDLPPVKGLVGWAMDLIEFSPELRPVLHQMIGGTVVMQDMNSAYVLYDKCGGRRPHVVTLAGEYLSPAGSVTGGSLKTDRAGLLKRKRLLEDNLELRSKQEEQLRSLSSILSGLQSKYRQAENDLEKATQDNREARRMLADLESEQRRLQRDREQVEHNIKRLEKEQLEISQRSDSREQTAQSLEQTLQQLESELRQGQDQLAQVQELDNQRSLERERRRQEVMQAEMRNNENLRKLEEKKRELESLRGRIKEIEEDSALARRELEQATAQRQGIEGKGQELKARIAELEAQLTGQNGQLDAYRAKSAQAKEEISRIKKEHEIASREARTRGEKYHRLLSELENLQANLETVRERLGDSLSTGEAPDLSHFDREKSLSRSRQLQIVLANFGSVNLGAVEEYERCLERQTELRENISDLESASESLKETIQEMDKASVAQFQKAFDSVNATFGRIFKEIFQGGWGRLQLTDPEDILESGVDIVACPPGKKLQNLALFSSGERTLAASAFLLSLLTYKPSPIVVLDELDAPLDDSNVEKIAKRLREFSASSQFLVITHNRKTMEYADRLYGVTMEEPGVSRMLSVELRDVESGNLTGETSMEGASGPFQPALMGA